MSRPDGGPAFPRPCAPHPGPDGDFGAPGMTLRDYFAAKAMQGLIAQGGSDPIKRSRQAYELADAMLAARNNEGSEDYAEDYRMLPEFKRERP